MQVLIQTARVLIGAMALVAGAQSCAERSPSVEAASPIPEAELQDELEALQARRSDVPGFAVTLQVWERPRVSAATGHAAPDGRAMTPDTPVRIASITKTFVAASILRLLEESLIDLDSPVGDLISAEHNAMLKSDGYDTEAITVRHLLMHASGLNDHFAGDVYKDMVLNEPDREWTRTDQLKVMIDETEPVGAPGDIFFYSDTGYILLGEIIERITGEPLGRAVRRLTKFEEIGLENVWWDAEDIPPNRGPRRAHQWLGDVDTFNIHGSVDAYGGGGIVASVEETARFFSALFSGEIFESPETLRLMMEAPGHPDGSPYRMGLFVTDRHGVRTYGHGGFWGTDVFVLPDHEMTIAGAALNATGVDDLRHLEASLVDLIVNDKSNDE